MYLQVLFSQTDKNFGIYSPTFDQDKKFTNVGNIGLTITNYGTIGHGFLYWNERQPSCEYPKGSRIEHIFLGGIWIGAEKKDTSGTTQTLVSTAAVDIGTLNRLNEGFEFTNDVFDSIKEKSTLSGIYFDTTAISHQDFICDYSDTRTAFSSGDSILNHIPLGVSIHQESYVWNYSFADFFVVLNYKIKNVGIDTLNNLAVGIWTNPAVRNTNLSGYPSGSEFYRHQGNGFVDSLRLAYTFDYDGQPYGNPADSYLGIKLLGTTPFPNFLRHSIDSLFFQEVQNIDELDSAVYYNAWKFKNSTGEEAYFYPTNDDDANKYLSKYKRLLTSLPKEKIIPLRLTPGNYTHLLSVGPFPKLLPNDSINVVYAVICAKKYGELPARFDSIESRKNLYSNLSWSQKAYDGEDINGNNILEASEDLNNNGILDRYVLPQPPKQPKVYSEVFDKNIVIYWDKTSETSIDPITKENDFEGYRIYRSNAGEDFQNPDDFILSLSLVGDFDLSNNQIGYNTGFEKIKLSIPKVVGNDTFYYRFPPAVAETSGLTHLNGWQYVYGISAYDRGDEENNLPQLESGKVLQRVIPGKLPTSNKNVEVGVYPNPYYANAYWDGVGEKNRKIIFYNLPQQCKITVLTLAGDVVAEIEHDAFTYNGNDINWFNRFENIGTEPKFSGGEHAWDLVTKFNQALATGLYLFAIYDRETQETKTGKFLIIK